MSVYKLVEEPLGPYVVSAVPNGAREYNVHLKGPDGRVIDSDMFNCSDAKARARFIERPTIARLPAEVRSKADEVLIDVGAKVDAVRLARERDPRPRSPDAGTIYAGIETAEQALERLNSEYAVVMLHDAPAVLWEGKDVDERLAMRFLSIDGFTQWLRPYCIMTAGGKLVPISKIWLDSDRRREYNGLVFAPNASVPRFYNLWQGFAVVPSPTGSCQRFLDHVHKNICNGNDHLFAWVKGWAAAIVQRPAQKTGTGLALRGGQGVGKTIFGKTMGRLLGAHYGPYSDARYIAGRFNSHLVNLLLLHLDEATWGGDHVTTGRLKDLITGDAHAIEYKGREPVTVRNHVRVLITSNSDWIVPAGLDERRFCVLDVAEHQKQNHEYFEKIDTELDNGGAANLLHYLLNYDLSNIDVGQVPNTGALFDQKLASFGSMQQWWQDTLAAGVLPGDTGGIGEAPVAAIYAAYLEHAKQTGQTRRAMETALGLFLRKTVPEIRRADGKTERLTKERRSQASNTGTIERPYFYKFPPLNDCRAAWNAMLSGAVVWDDDPKAEETWGAYVPRIGAR